jgi:hypothetical protein
VLGASRGADAQLARMHLAFMTSHFAGIATGMTTRVQRLDRLACVLERSGARTTCEELVFVAFRVRRWGSLRR